MVRAKFEVTCIIQHSWHPTGRTVLLEPRYDVSIPEDVRFAQYTPSGKFEMFVDNPAALRELKVGKKFYIDLTEVE